MIPVFEGLFPANHGDVIWKLLFRLAQWHALAKLRFHTNESLNYLDRVTRLLGGQLQKFRDFTCTSFNTTELPSETAAHRQRKETKLSTSDSTAHTSSAAHPKLFNLSMYKLHTLGDYVHAICLFGTTDSYTMQIVSHKFLVVSCQIQQLSPIPGRAFSSTYQEILSIHKQAGTSRADCKARKMTYTSSAPIQQLC